MSDPREALVTALRRAANRCCQCTDGHHEQDSPYGTDSDVRISRDDARKIADILAEFAVTPRGEGDLWEYGVRWGDEPEGGESDE